MALTNIRRVVVMRGTLRGREVEFIWDDGEGKRLGSEPSSKPGCMVDALTRKPMPWNLTPDEEAVLQEAITT